MDMTLNVGPIDRPDVEIYSPGFGWGPATDWVYLTPKGLERARTKGIHPLRYTWRWRIKEGSE